jgi:glycosyltransferase involved in cell wall biosynthesis
VETGVYFPVEQQAARRALGWGRLEDYWIVGMVAANKGRPSRKAFPQQLEAFARFHKRHPKSCLYIHSVIGEYDEEHGINLRVLVERLGLAGCVRFCEQYQNMLGYADEHMRLVYSALDILMNVSLGEGFGIPLVEAQACGCPVVTGGWTAMPELCWAGYCVHREMAEPWWTPLEAYQFVPHVDEIDAALELAWLTDEDERLELRARAAWGVGV